MSESQSYESQSLTSSKKILVTPDIINPIQEKLQNPKTPLPERFRCVFTLKNLGGMLAINALASVFNDESVLLKHEVAYAIGQMRDINAIPILTNLLSDSNQHPVVRHEAGEALGAIGSNECLSIVEKFINDPSQEVKETCELAVERIKWLQSFSDPIEREKHAGASEFYTVDPAPSSQTKDIKELGLNLCNDKLPIFERYCSLFALRDINNDESVKELIKGFNSSSALLRHEIAYVLGQMQNSVSFEGLNKVLENSNEHPMVRHEAAEALGALSCKNIENILKKYINDKEPLVSESCLVALDMSDYFNSDTLEYANAL